MVDVDTAVAAFVGIDFVVGSGKKPTAIQSASAHPRSMMTRRRMLGFGLTAMAAAFAGCTHTSSSPTLTSVSRSATPTPNVASNAAAIVTPAAPTARHVVFLDPGHGGVDQGAIGVSNDGQTVMEKTITLAITQQAQSLLQNAGFEVVLSRTADTLPGVTPDDLTADGQALTPDGVLNDLQRRIDRANDSHAELFLSIHLNANDDPAARGTETYYDSTRTYGVDNKRWAEHVQSGVIDSLHGQGYTTPDRGIIDDTQLESDSLGALPDSYNHLVLLGPAVNGMLRPTLMTGALNESLFLSNPDEASAALDPQMQNLIATGYAQAVIHYFQSPS